MPRGRTSDPSGCSRAPQHSCRRRRARVIPEPAVNRPTNREDGDGERSEEEEGGQDRVVERPIRDAIQRPCRALMQRATAARCSDVD